MRPRLIQRARQGFTLVELLVVIGIISVLISILMPALGRAKLKAQSVQCASNMRQIYMLCMMFSQDNKGHLPRSSWSSNVYQPGGSTEYIEKLNVWGQGGTNAPNGDGRGWVDMEYGALWRYLPGIESRKNLTICPGDNGEGITYGGVLVPGIERNFSYSFHAYSQDRTDPEMGLYRIDSTTRGTVPKPGIRISTIKSSAERIYIWEEVGPNDGWCLHPMDDAYRGIVRNKDDYPTGRHGGNRALNAMRDQVEGSPGYNEWLKSGSGNHCFFDGHVESLAPGQIMNDKRQNNYYLPLTDQ